MTGADNTTLDTSVAYVKDLYVNAGVPKRVFAVKLAMGLAREYPLASTRQALRDVLVTARGDSDVLVRIGAKELREGVAGLFGGEFEGMVEGMVARISGLER